MNYLIWGTGSDAKVFLSEHWQEFFIKNSILAFIDNNEKKVGKTFFDKIIIHPCMINQYNFDKIIICSSYETEIKEQTNNLNIESKYVITKNDFCNEIYNKLIQNDFFSRKILIVGDRKRFMQLEDIYRSLFNIVGCVDIHSLEKIKEYQYDFIILMNLMNIIDLDRTKGSIQLEKELVKILIKNHNISPKKIYTDTVYFLARNIDRKVSWGDKYPEKTFLVIQLSGTGGLGIFIKNVVCHIHYAKTKGYIPVVDMMTYKNQYLEKSEIGKINAWEKFFEQPAGYTMNDIQHSKNIVLSFQKPFNDDYLFSFSQTLKIKTELQRKISKYNETLFKKNVKILGVLFRGSDYSNRKPYQHPIQPDLETMISKVKEKSSEWGWNTGFDFIYLCTEVEEAILRFQEEFHEKLCYYPQKRVSANCCEYLSSITFDRENDTYLRGADYFIALNALSKCDSLIAGMCTGTSLALGLNNNKYNHTYIFNLGKYGIDDI